MVVEELITNINQYGNAGATYTPFDGGVCYPLRSMDFVRTGFLKVAPTLAARDYKDPKRTVEMVKAEIKDNWTWNIDGVLYQIRIRKLTPRECWRLMSFSDEDFEKAAETCSNTQLYKQAGNSIVKNVLMEVMGELFE